MSFAQIKLAAGKFITSQEDPKFFDDNEHHINTWGGKLPMVRNTMVGHHPLIIGLLFLDKNYTVRVLSAPYPDTTSFDKGRKLGESLGDGVFAENSVAVDEGELFGDAMTLVPTVVIPEEFSLTMGPVHTCVETDATPDKEFWVTIVPVCIPLVVGHSVIEGPITSELVHSTLTEYCKVGGVWAVTASWMGINNYSSHEVKPFDKNWLHGSISYLMVICQCRSMCYSIPSTGIYPHYMRE